MKNVGGVACTRKCDADADDTDGNVLYRLLTAGHHFYLYDESVGKVGLKIKQWFSSLNVLLLGLIPENWYD